MKKKSIFVLAIAMLIFATSLSSEIFAQDKENRRGRGNKKHGECIKTQKRDSLCNFMQNEIIPEMQEIKNTFDANLSKKDLEELNTLRAAAADLRKHALNPTNKRNDRRSKNMTSEDKDTFRNSRMEHKNRMNAIHNDLKAIMERNSISVDALTRSLEQLTEKHGAARFLQGHPQRNRNMRKLQNEEEEIKTPIRRQIGSTIPVAQRFLLWNGMANTIDESFENANTQSSVINHPNPFTETTNISFNIPQSGTVVIDLYDNSGNHLEQIFNGKLSQGRNSVEFSASSIKNLQPGVLIYKIKSNNIEQSGKMLYSK